MRKSAYVTLTLLGNSGPERDMHRLDDIVGAVRLSDDDLDDVGGSHRGLQRLLVSCGQDPGPVLQGGRFLHQSEEVPVILIGAGQVVHDHVRGVHLDERHQVERPVLNVRQPGRHRLEAVVLEGRANGLDHLVTASGSGGIRFAVPFLACTGRGLAAGASIGSSVPNSTSMGFREVVLSPKTRSRIDTTTTRATIVARALIEAGSRITRQATALRCRLPATDPRTDGETPRRAT